MKIDGRYLKDKNRVFAKALLPLAITTVLVGCDSEYTPAEPFTPAPLTDAERDTSGNSQVENLDLGLIVIPAEDAGENAISWRLSGLDEQRVVFKVYKNGEFMQSARPGDPTFLVDINGLPTDTYQVKSFVDDVEKSASKVVQAQAKPYLAIPLSTPANGFVDGVEHSYTANDVSAADLTGDGQYELIVKWEPDNAKDNSQAGKTGDVLIDAYTLEGELLWRINLGQNIRAGAHYTQFIAYDFNQDGRAEVAMKTADGTIDGRGNVIGDAEAEYRDDAGFITDGPEFLTMFDGISGEAISTIDYIPPRGDRFSWGKDSDGTNRVDRFLAGVAYLDGKVPSLIMSRGYYGKAVVATFNFDGENLTTNWVYDSSTDTTENNIAGQGAHSLSVADVDGDGKDEIIFGAGTLDDDGTSLYNTGLGHGDALHVTDIVPSRPGLEVMMVHEGSGAYINENGNFGVEVHDAATGEILYSQPSNGDGDDVGRGLTGDIDPNYPGLESWGSRGGLMAADGTVISQNKPSMNFMTWWDGDLSREMLDGNAEGGLSVTKWNPDDKIVEKEALFDSKTVKNGTGVSNNGTKATPGLSADILGDWREEIVTRNEDSTKLLVYVSNIPTDIRLPTLMHDRQYRTAVAWQNVGYNQPPHPSFYMGSDMKLYDHLLKDLPQFKTTAVAGTPATNMVAQGNNNNIIVKVYGGSSEVGSVNILRATSNDKGAAQSVGMLEGGETTFVDTSAVPDTTYYYWTEVKDSSGNTIAGLDHVSQARMTSTLIPRLEVASLNNYIDLTWVTNLQLESIHIYRAETTEMGVIPEKPQAYYATVNANAKTWTDAETTDGSKYYYWVELTTKDGKTVITDPVFGENILAQETNLDYTYKDGVMTICWDFKNFDPITYIELLRNTQNQASGRTRVVPFGRAETPAFAEKDCYVDTAVTPKPAEGEEPAVPADVNYWYMFKYNTATASNVTSEIVGPFITTEGSRTNFTGEADPVLETINLTWELRNFGQSITNVNVYRNTTDSLDGRVLVKENARATDGRLRDTGGDTGFTNGTTYWYSFEVTLEDGTVVDTTPEGNILFELPQPESNIITRLEDGGIRIDWNLKYYSGVYSNIEIIRNTEASADGAVVVASNLEPRSAYADYDESLVELQSYWYMMRVTLEDGTVITDEPTSEIVYQKNPSTTSVTIQENADGYCEMQTGLLESNWAGYEGDGFSNTDNAEGMYISYKVNVREAGTYRFLLRYANGAADNRYASVTINNTANAFNIDMDGTGTWDTWLETYSSYDLQPGETTIKLVSATAGGLGNIDSLTIDNLTGTQGPTAIACAP
ncbi:hypothetical protein N7931_12980 [Catenovulum sp. 2E275]|uniref:rhamnogalacturonan lyase family protein n=1 Tax=Catenovulum sp. 2E275 TaxID=2980497 RepID=UPI0021CDFD6F|nr:carbohydrate-binding protein [Catenovulum sp. 2E275]MCU4676544.1 hypothetical protein [Catenovulum sp. 2E275]